MNCTYCGEELEGEELDSPRKDWGDDAMCDDCYHEHCEFTCDLCEEYGDNDDQHKMLIVWDAEEAGVPAGLYRVKRLPYYMASMLGGGMIYPWAVERVDNVPRPRAEDDYACGHLCGGCQHQYKEVFSALRDMNS